MTRSMTALRLVIAWLCLCLPAGAIAGDAFGSQKEFSRWVAFYYRHPEPERIADAIRYMSASGILDKDHAVAPMFGFLSGVFRDHPGRVRAWVGKEDAVEDRHLGVLVLAVWYARLPESREIAGALLARRPELEANMGFVHTQPPATVERIPIERGAWVLDALWGKFMATGDSAPVERIIGVLPWAEAEGDADRMLIGGAARWSLTSNAVQHPRVLEICLRAEQRLAGVEAAKLAEVISDARRQLTLGSESASTDTPW